MWTITTGVTTGVGAGNVNRVLSLVDEAMAYWAYYADLSAGVMDITVNFISLGEDTLAQAGTNFFSIGGGVIQAATILELQDGNDRNGPGSDIDIDVNLDSINANEFHYGGFDDPVSPQSSRYDLFTVLVHEIGHGLGFLSFMDLPPTAVFDTFIAGYPGAPRFTGANAVAVYGGNVPMFEDPSHLADSLSSYLMNPYVVAGQRLYIHPLEVAILQDAGLPVLMATGGDDTLYGYMLPDEAFLGAGNDVYSGLAGADTVHGEGGSDRLNGDQHNDFLYGGPGDDTLSGGSGGDLLDGAGGYDFADYSDDPAPVAVNLSGAPLSIPLGTLQPNWAQDGYEDIDTLAGVEGAFGSAFGDTLLGGDGADNRFFGHDGNDWLSGLGGNDLLDGGKGNDYALGGAGDDTLIGFVGNDTLAGNAGDDKVQGGGGDDKVYGNGGNDRIYGGSGEDTLAGSAGLDTMHGGAGDDKVYGNGDNDRLSGQEGNDLLVGAAGDDQMFGGQGDDTMRGGAGNDTMQGGAGADVYEFEPGTGNDVVNGFSSAQGDRVFLKGFGAAFDDFADVFAASSQAGADTVIDLGGGDSVTLTNIDLASLAAGDFLFG